MKKQKAKKKKIEKKNKKNEEKDYEDYENKYEHEDETISQETINNLSNNLDEIIDKSKSFEEQIKSLKKQKI